MRNKKLSDMYKETQEEKIKHENTKTMNSKRNAKTSGKIL